MMEAPTILVNSRNEKKRHKNIDNKIYLKSLCYSIVRSTTTNSSMSATKASTSEQHLHLNSEMLLSFVVALCATVFFVAVALLDRHSFRTICYL